MLALFVTAMVAIFVTIVQPATERDANSETVAPVASPPE